MMARGNNRQRAWMDGGFPGPVTASPDMSDLQGWLTHLASVAHGLLDAVREVGHDVQRCRRLRQAMPQEVLKHHGDALDWYIVLWVVGVIDRQGVCLLEPPAGERT